MSFYSNFIRFCNFAKETPSHVVLAVGLKKPAVTRWKNGGKPTDATAQKLADYFGVSVSDLMEEEPKEKPIHLPIEDGLSEVQKEAVELINKMDNEALSRFIASAKIMLGLE